MRTRHGTRATAEPRLSLNAGYAPTCPLGVPRAAKAAGIAGPRSTLITTSSCVVASSGATSVTAAPVGDPGRPGSPSACQPAGSARLKPRLASTYRLAATAVAVVECTDEA